MKIYVNGFSVLGYSFHYKWDVQQKAEHCLTTSDNHTPGKGTAIGYNSEMASHTLL